MFTGLKGLVLKSKNSKERETRYTVILGRRLLFPWMYKTATLYKDLKNNSPYLELFVNEYASSIKEIKKRNLTSPDDEEWEILSEDLKKLPEEQKEYLRRNIENIPEKVKNAIYKTLDIELSSTANNNSLYGFEMQKVKNINSNLESLSKKLSEKFCELPYTKV